METVYLEVLLFLQFQLVLTTTGIVESGAISNVIVIHLKQSTRLQRRETVRASQHRKALSKN